MRRVLFIIAMFCSLEATAQTHLISFAGTGASSSVNTVEVENLTAGTSHTLNGDDVLRLTMTTRMNSIENGQSSEMKIYPNPMTDKSTLLISAPEAGDAVISVYDITGRRLVQIESYIENYSQEFTLSSLKSGLYFINVKGDTYQFSGKVISNGKPNGTATIVKVSDNISVDNNMKIMDAKGVQATVDMEYTTGDRLKFKGISGIYSTVLTDIPDADKTITFNFIACSDVDNNNYPIVAIGTQVWMAENLKTTKYNDNANIPIVLDNTVWANLTSHGYCWYNNDANAFKATYGALYNWYAVNTGKLCPTGWHVPTDAECTTLTTYLGGEGVAGGKLKETGTSHWQTPNTGATNETGFTALPGGYRYATGFYDMGYGIPWWSATEYDDSYAYYRFLLFGDGTVHRSYVTKRYGYYVRCIKDELPLAETLAATEITSSTATLNGRVNPNELSTVVTFDYGLNTNYGTSVTATQSPLGGYSNKSVSVNISSLSVATTYHYRVKATNSEGEAYGEDMTFSTNAMIILTIEDATSWTPENHDLIKVQDATAKLFASQSSFENNLPDFTATSDMNGIVQFDVPFQEQYYLIVEKGDLSNIKDDYVIVGVFDNQGEIDSSPYQVNAQIGGLRYWDFFPDGAINSEDQIGHDIIFVNENQTTNKTVVIGK